MQAGNSRAVEDFEKHAEEQAQAEQAQQAASRKLQRLLQKTAELEQRCEAAHRTHDAGKTEALKVRLGPEFGTLHAALKSCQPWMRP